MGNTNVKPNLQHLHPQTETGNAFEKLKLQPFYNDLNQLMSSIEGQVILPLHELYQEARTRPYNLEFRGYPLVITRPKNASDVSKIVSFVREKGGGIPVGIQCGGHSTRCMITDSFSIDLVHINDVQLDKEKMLVNVGGGAYLKNVDEVLKPHNLGTPVGTYPLTGVGGLVLAGGYGHLSKLYGLSVDNLVEVEVVLADGRIVIANDYNEFADLIWGCRGGGGNFGIVTKFTLSVHKLPPNVLAGFKVFLVPTLHAAKTVHQNMDKLISTLPDSISTFTVFPAGDPVVPTLWTYFGDQPSIRDVPELNLRPAGGWLCLQDDVRPASYHSDVQTLTQPMNLPGHASYTSLVQVGQQTEPLPESFFDEMLAHTRKSLPRSLHKALCILFSIGGKVAIADDGTKTAINEALRHARYFVIIEAVWKEAAGEDGRLAARSWVKEAAQICGKYRVMAMLHAPDSINDSAVEAAARSCSKMVATLDLNDKGVHDSGYSETMAERLGKIKGIYDPNNFFRQNANILPVF